MTTTAEELRERIMEKLELNAEERELVAAYVNVMASARALEDARREEFIAHARVICDELSARFNLSLVWEDEPVLPETPT